MKRQPSPGEHPAKPRLPKAATPSQSQASPPSPDPESSLPGGGAARRDAAGHSGVYPVSGPHPEGPAELRAAPEWGQGARGALGSEEAGRSGLLLRGGEALGGLAAGLPGSPPQPVLAISQEGWTQALEEFSRMHKHCWVTLEEIGSSGACLQASGVPLLAVGADLRNGRATAYVTLGSDHEYGLTHIVRSPVAVRLRLPWELEFDRAGDVRTVIRCIGHRPALVH
jgi:hypothetical protein